jgi:hypothetical protein
VVQRRRSVRLTTTATSIKCGSLDVSKRYGPPQPVTRREALSYTQSRIILKRSSNLPNKQFPSLATVTTETASLILFK